MSGSRRAVIARLPQHIARLGTLIRPKRTEIRILFEVARVVMRVVWIPYRLTDKSTAIALLRVAAVLAIRDAAVANLYNFVAGSRHSFLPFGLVLISPTRAQ